MTMNTYIAAYDIGTSGMKLVLIRPGKRVAGVVQGSYPLHSPAPGFAQQDPEVYWDTVCRITKEALDRGMVRPEQVAGMVFAAQWKGIIPVNHEMQPLHPAILWLDRRGGKQAEELNRRLEGAEFRDSDYWPKLLWLKEERPKLYQETEQFLEINAWVKYRACGSLASDVTSHFTRSFSGKEQQWYHRILKTCGIPEEMFPRLVTPETEVGTLTSQAAEETGLLAGTPVLAGCGDIPAIARGLDCIEDGDAHIYLGSSGWFGVTGEAGIWPGCRISGFDRSRKICFQGLEAVGLALDWSFANLFEEEQRRMGDGIFQWMNGKLAEIGPGSGGLLAIPSFYGENRPFSPHLQAAFLRMNSTHTRFHMHQALMEGICYMYRFHKESYEAGSGRRVTDVRAAGGGALNGRWMQMMADVFGCRVHVSPDPQYAGSIGAACWAMQGLGMADTSTRDCMENWKCYEPEPTAKQIYDEMYPAFLRAIEETG